MIIIEEPEFKENVRCNVCIARNDSIKAVKFSHDKNTTTIRLCRNCRIELAMSLQDDLRKEGYNECIR